jgi:transcriptional regulator with PAS, ATPase and Fis domain
MAKRKTDGETYSNRLLFERSADPVFVLNQRRRLRYANPAWEKLVRQTLEDAYNLHCVRDRRATPLAQALSPPTEVLAGAIAKTRRAAPPSRVGPPWWDISFLPLMGPDGLLGIVGRIVVLGSSSGPRARVLPEGLVQLRQRMIGRYTFAELESDLPAFELAVEQARVASRNMTPVAIVGEAGVGKAWLARTIHSQGIAVEKAFLPIDCAGLPASALENLLFGEAILGSTDRVGTVFLRDASALPRDLQARLMTSFSQRRDDFPRIIAGLRNEPAVEASRGHLIEDLRLALSVQVIRLPALRERIVDLPRIVELLFKRINQTIDEPSSGISPAVMDAFAAYDWPGNLRELTTVLAIAAKKAKGGLIEPAHLPQSFRANRSSDGTSSPDVRDAQLPLGLTLKDVQRRLILFALWRSRGQKAAAARFLDLSRSELWRRMGEMNIGEDEWRTLEGQHTVNDALPPNHPL